MSNLSERVIALRKRENLNQEAFGERTGVSRNTISTIERTGLISNDVAESICQSLDVSRDWLLTGKGKAPAGVHLTDTTENPWENALVKQLKDENAGLKEMIEFLKTLIPRQSFPLPTDGAHSGKIIPLRPWAMVA